LCEKLPPSCHLYPIVPSGHARIKTLFRFQFLIKTEQLKPLLPRLSELKAAKAPSDIRTFIDVDPLSTFF
jgi:primosomal protein N' (replication factor Y)